MKFSTDQDDEVQMIYQNGDSEGLQVTLVGPNLYRLECSSFFDEAQYHDVVETEAQTDGSLRFVRVVGPSGLKTVYRILSKSQIESPNLARFLNEVASVGGHWERIFDGLLILSLRPEDHDRLLEKLEDLCKKE